MIFYVQFDLVDNTVACILQPCLVIQFLTLILCLCDKTHIHCFDEWVVLIGELQSSQWLENLKLYDNMFIPIFLSLEKSIECWLVDK
jgi:hypothetical protein